MQDLPTQCRQQEELIQPEIYGHRAFAADPLSERGALGLFSTDLTSAYIFFRPNTREKPYTIAELRQRAAAVVGAINGGTFDTLWQSFIRPLRDAPAGGDEDMDDEGDCDADPRSITDLPPK